MTPAQLWQLCKQAVSAWIDDEASSLGAAIAYYTMFSIAPLLLIAISMASLVFERQAASGEVIEQLRDLMGDAGATAVQAMLESAARPTQSFAATVIGSVLLLVGATSVFSELQHALDRVWRAPTAVKETGFAGFVRVVRARLLSFGMVMGVGFLLMTSLVFSTAISLIGRWAGERFATSWEVLANALNFVVSYGLETLVFALIFKTIPRVKIAWRDVWVGALVTALLFNVGKLLIGLYIGKSGVTSVFGAAGSLAVLLLWVYYSAQVFLLGAEFSKVFAHTFGSCSGGCEQR
jgi:membrane protein